jgi:N-acetylneuraminate synthase
MFDIGNRRIGRDAPPLFIAEMSGNHNGSLDRALAIVDAIAATGAHALKLQTYTADTMTLDCDAPDFVIGEADSLWAGRHLHALYHEAHTPWEWHAPIFERARKHGMLAFSTPFDATAVDFLDELDVPCFKIASFENTDLPLIRKAASKGKPLIISTGLATIVEIGEAVEAAREAGCRDLVLLKCTSTYPASPADSHLLTIPHLRETFGCEVGLSDHTLGIGAAVASVALGGTVIEKHVTLRRADGGVDSAFSLEPEEVRLLVEETERARQALGSVHFGPSQREMASLKYRRSLYVAEDMEEGEPFTAKNVRAVRPGFGLATRHVDAVLGRRATRALKKGTPLAWSLVG